MVTLNTPGLLYKVETCWQPRVLIEVELLLLPVATERMVAMSMSLAVSGMVTVETTGAAMCSYPGGRITLEIAMVLFL